MTRIVSLIRRMLLVLLVPVAWARSLLASRVLLKGEWSRYMGFRPANALNAFFYRTQWLNLRRYGRSGTSPTIGLGDHDLSRWFHLSYASSAVYANAGAVTMLAGTLLWALSHLVWLQDRPATWVAVITGIVLLSSTSYAMAFVRQNYNILGWMWLPIAFYALLAGQWVMLAIALLAAALFSFTAMTVMVPVVIAQVIAVGDLSLLLALIPGGTWLCVRAIPALRSLGTTARAIGLAKSDSRYGRRSMRFGVFNAFYAGLYILGCGAFWLLHGELPVLAMLSTVLFIVNQRFARFADEQSVMLLVVTAFAAQTVIAEPGLAGLAVLFAVANPFPFMIGITADKWRLATYAPFDHSRIEAACDAFLAPVPAGSRVLIAFDDPEGVYERIFDGYRAALEPFLYVASRRGIHLMPDWYAVADTDSADSPPIWGRSTRQLLGNLARWQAGYAIHYMESGSEPPVEMLEEFEVVGKIDWADHLDQVRDAPPWSAGKACPVFLLLKRRDT